MPKQSLIRESEEKLPLGEGEAEKTETGRKNKKKSMIKRTKKKRGQKNVSVTITIGKLESKSQCDHTTTHCAITADAKF